MVMSISMTRSEREVFLAQVHVGVLSVQQDGRGPLTVPVWYSYEPGGTINVITGEESMKGVLIAASGRFSLCAQDQASSVQVRERGRRRNRTRKPVDPAERRAMAHRYLGEELAICMWRRQRRTRRAASCSACRPSLGSRPTSRSSSCRRLDQTAAAFTGAPACRQKGPQESGMTFRIELLREDASDLSSLSLSAFSVTSSTFRRELVCSADKFLGHFECRVDDLAPWTTVAGRLRENAVHVVQEPAHRLQRDVLGTLDRVDEAGAVFLGAGRSDIHSSRVH